MGQEYNPDDDFTSQIFVYDEEPHRTDLAKYKARAPMLIPQDGKRTTFTIKTDEDKLRFYISSSTEVGLQQAEVFFGGMYRCHFEHGDLPYFKSERSFLMMPRISNYRGSRIFSSPFLKTLTSVPMALGVNMMMQVIVCSYTTRRREKKYGFWLEVGLEGRPEHHQQIVDLVRITLNNMVDDRGVSLKLDERKDLLRIQRNMFTDPFELASFIRIPDNEETESARILSHTEPKKEPR